MGVSGSGGMMWSSMVVVLVLLAMIQQSKQQSFRISNPQLLPHRSFTETPAFAIVVTSTNAEKAFYDSGFFVTYSHLDLFGRKFVIGTIYGANVVFVRTSSNPSIHVGITVQILVDNFKLQGIINFGSAGATNRTLSIGSVFVPSLITFSGTWEWLAMDSPSKGQLQFDKYNHPQNGENLLGSVRYGLIDVYENGNLGIRQYIPVTQNWLRLASRIAEVDSAEVIVGSKSSSSDTYIDNPSYSEFLYKTFQVSTVDTSSAGVGLAAKSCGVDFIVFRGVSNYAGAENSIESSSASELANKNAAEAVIKFIWLATMPLSDM